MWLDLHLRPQYLLHTRCIQLGHQASIRRWSIVYTLCSRCSHHLHSLHHILGCRYSCPCTVLTSFGRRHTGRWHCIMYTQTTQQRHTSAQDMPCMQLCYHCPRLLGPQHTRCIQAQLRSHGSTTRCRLGKVCMECEGLCHHQSGLACKRRMTLPRYRNTYRCCTLHSRSCYLGLDLHGQLGS